MDYAGRSRDMFLNYRKIQRISVEMEELGRQIAVPVTAEAVKNLSVRYQAVLDETENHTPGDHLRHFSRSLSEGEPYFSKNPSLYRQRRRAVAANFFITAFPYLSLALPLALMLPLIGQLIP